MDCDPAVAKKGELTAESRRAKAATKVLDAQFWGIVTVNGCVCPQKEEIVAVSDKRIGLDVIPDCGAKLPGKCLVRRSKKIVRGVYNRTTRQKGPNTGNEAEGAAHR